MSVELLPCRYCGGRAKVFRHPYSQGGWYFVGCTQKGHTLPTKPLYYPSGKKAAAAWNEFMSTAQMELKEVPDGR